MRIFKIIMKIIYIRNLNNLNVGYVNNLNCPILIKSHFLKLLNVYSLENKIKKMFTIRIKNI